MIIYCFIYTRFSALNITPAFQISWSTTWLAKRWARVCLLGSAHSILGASQRSHLRCFCGKNIKAEYYFELKILEHMDAAALMRFDFIGLESRGICNPATRYIEASRAAFESESKLYPESCNFCCRPCKSRWKLKQQQHTGVIDRFEDLNRRTFGLQ